MIIQPFRTIIICFQGRMWSWHREDSNKSESKPSFGASPFKSNYKCSPLFDNPLSSFNLRAHYEQLKRNHPFYQELHQQPTQNLVK